MHLLDVSLHLNSAKGLERIRAAIRRERGLLERRGAIQWT